MWDSTLQYHTLRAFHSAAGLQCQYRPTGHRSVFNCAYTVLIRKRRVEVTSFGVLVGVKQNLAECCVHALM